MVRKRGALFGNSCWLGGCGHSWLGARSKRGAIWDTLPPWVIALAVLVIVLLFVFLLRGELGTLGDSLRGVLG